MAFTQSLPTRRRNDAATITSKKNGLSIKNIAKELKDKRFSFFADPQKTKECHRTFAHLVTYTHLADTGRQPKEQIFRHTFFCMYFKMFFLTLKIREVCVICPITNSWARYYDFIP